MLRYCADGGFIALPSYRGLGLVMDDQRKTSCNGLFELVDFQSEGARLRGRLYRSSGAEPSPCVVMAHGTSATIGMVAENYAEAFHRSGMSVLLYDHRNFGDSGGVPRQEINPWIQARGYRDAVAFLRTRSEVDADRIVLWGDSYSATQILVVGALIGGLAAIVAQIPACGIELPSVQPSDKAFASMKATFENGDVSCSKEMATGPIPVVSCDQLNIPSLLKPIQAFRWFMEYGGRHGSKWENRVTRVTPRTPVPFTPCLTAPYIRIPTLMMVGRGDEMEHCNRSVQVAVFDSIAAPKVFHEVDGGHFGLLWNPGTIFDEAAALQTKFLRDLFSV
jgi:pimeloyl-ACP methyl ester carboxylesterase